MIVDEREATASGDCLCGAVRYEVRGALRPVIYCHWLQCRRTSGHFVAAAGSRSEDLVLLQSRGLKWCRSSEAAEALGMLVSGEASGKAVLVPGYTSRAVH